MLPKQDSMPSTPKWLWISSTSLCNLDPTLTAQTVFLLSIKLEDRKRIYWKSFWDSNSSRKPPKFCKIWTVQKAATLWTAQTLSNRPNSQSFSRACSTKVPSLVLKTRMYRISFLTCCSWRTIKFKNNLSLTESSKTSKIISWNSTRILRLPAWRWASKTSSWRSRPWRTEDSIKLSRASVSLPPRLTHLISLWRTWLRCRKALTILISKPETNS